MGLRSALLRRDSVPVAGKTIPPMPSWLKPEYIQRLDLARRWRTVFSRSLSHPWSPEPCDALFANPYSHRMEEYVPDLSGAPVEFRHPFLDLRLIRYSLRLPAFPYLVNKEVMRRSFRDELPCEIISRPKTPMFEDNLAASLRKSTLPSLSGEVCNWVDAQKLEDALASAASEMSSWTQIRPFVLNYFLQTYQLSNNEEKTA